MCLDTAFCTCCPPHAHSRYLSGVAGELQVAVDVLSGLVIVAYEPEEEASIVQGRCAGGLADFLQAALKLLNGFLVWESERGKRASQSEEGRLGLQDALRAHPSTRGRLLSAWGPGNHRSRCCLDLGLLSEGYLFSPVPSSLPNPPPQAHNPSREER